MVSTLTLKYLSWYQWLSGIYPYLADNKANVNPSLFLINGSWYNYFGTWIYFNKHFIAYVYPWLS